MMWFRCVILLFWSCVARRNEEIATDMEDVEEEEKLYTVQVDLTLADTSKSAIEIAVNGVRHLTKTHSTEEGRPVVLHHLQRGSVITAHVNASRDACAFWVAGGETRHTVGNWEVAFGYVDESDQNGADAGGGLYEAYVKIVGKGQAVTIEVNHGLPKEYQVQPDETLRYPGLHRGTLVKVVSVVSGETCIYNVDMEETASCSLDSSWGVRIGSVQMCGEDNHDDEVHVMDDIKNYTMELALTPGEDHAEVLEITLNGHRVAEKRKATEVGESIILHHVKTGSVLAAVSHLTGQACGIYVGIGMQTETCAGWTLTFNLQEETDSSFEGEKLWDVSYMVHLKSTEPAPRWSIWMSQPSTLSASDKPIFFPRVVGGFSEGIQVIPVVNGVRAENCTHVIGGPAITSCEYGGWLFTLNSHVNMNYDWKTHHWDYGDEDELSEIDVDDEDGRYKFEVKAADTTTSKSRLECIAREDLEYTEAPVGEPKTISNGNLLFKPKTLVRKLSKKQITMNVKTASFIGEMVGEINWEGGFTCIVYDDNDNKMCEADTNGKSQTTIQGCTIHIVILREIFA